MPPGNAELKYMALGLMVTGAILSSAAPLENFDNSDEFNPELNNEAKNVC